MLSQVQARRGWIVRKSGSMHFKKKTPKPKSYTLSPKSSALIPKP